MPKNEDVQLNSIWTGYENLKDPTNMPTTALAPGSLNVLINNSEKIYVRPGTSYKGAVGTQNNGIIGSQYKFVNPIGLNLPTRIFKDDNNAGFDRMEMWYNGAWEPVTSNGGSELPNAPHRYYFSSWYDKGTASSPKNNTLSVFVGGTGNVNVWTGAVAIVTNVGANFITIATTFASQGFYVFPTTTQVMAGGSIFDLVGTFAGVTITLVQNPTGIVNIGDIVTQAIWSSSPGNLNFDYCSTLYNQVYYGDFDKRLVSISNDENQDAHLDAAAIYSNANLTLAGLNDASFTGTYTGTTNSQYQVVINKADKDAHTFSTPSGLGVDDITINFAGYVPTVTNTYRIVVDATVTNYLLYKNGVFTATAALLGAPNLTVIAIDGLAITLYDGLAHQPGDQWDITASGVDNFVWYFDGNIQGGGTPILVSVAPVVLSNGVSVQFTALRGHSKGDSWTIGAYRLINTGWVDFVYTQPTRLPGEGFQITLDSAFLTMTPQEKEMYIFGQGGEVYTVIPQLAADLKSETISVNKLKSDEQGKPLQPYLLGYFRNMLSAVTSDKAFTVLGRQQFLELPQGEILSDKVKYDFEPADFIDGDILYYKRTLYISLPQQNQLFIFDDSSKYWNPPQSFAKRVSLLAVIDNEVIGHSYENNESYKLSDTSAFNDLKTSTFAGFPIAAKISLAYNNYDDRFKLKKAGVIGFEGYMTGAPLIKYRINFDLGGCSGNYQDKIDAIYCYPEDTASLGKSSLGKNSLGSSPAIPPKFRDRKEFTLSTFYEVNVELSCDSIYQDWSLIGIGLYSQDARINNKKITSNPII